MKRVIGIFVAGVAIGAVGCETTHPNTAVGAGVGTAIGAGTGLAIGAATGNPKTGALVGAALGAGTGAAIGAEADERDRERATRVQVAQAQAQAAQVAQSQQMGMTDVVELCRTGAAPQVVINQIHATGSRFTLSNADIQYLMTNNVPQEVIAAMQQTQNQPAKVIYQTPPRTVVYESYPYGPVYVAPTPVYVRPAFGFVYARHW
jgi:hypothetical protein